MRRLEGLGGKALAGALAAGALNGLLAVVTAVAFAALIFRGPLAAEAEVGLALALFAAAVLGLVIALMSGYRGMVGGIAEPAAILGLAAAEIAAVLGQGTGATLLATVLATLLSASLLTGLFLTALGHFRWGHLTRYIPPPVVGGFLAGVGWLLLAGAVETLTGRDLAPDDLGALVSVEMMLRWLPAVLLGALVCLLRRKRPSGLNLPVVLALAVAAFWAIQLLGGAETETLRSQGWLVAATSSTLVLPHGQLIGLLEADWALVLQQTPYLAALLVVGLLGLLATGTNLELALRHDIDINRELKAAGIANLLSGLGAGLPGYQRVGATMRTRQMEMPHRLAGVFAALICLLALLFAGPALAYLPKLIAGVLLCYLGFELLVTWIWDARLQLSQGDFTIVVLVFLTVVLVGFLEGVGVGVVAGVILFAINYNRVEIVKNELSGAQIQSNVERAEALHRILRQEGERIHVMMLQDFLYFGTAQNLLTRIERRAKATG